MIVAHCLCPPSIRGRIRQVVIVVVVTLLCLYQPFGVLVGALANVLALWGVFAGGQVSTRDGRAGGTLVLEAPLRKPGSRPVGSVWGA